MKATKTSQKSVITICSQDHPRKDEADIVCPGESDQEAINEAIHSLPALGGKIVLLPGVYNISRPIVPDRDNLVIDGLVRDATIISPSKDLQAGIFQDLSPSAETPRSGLTIRDLTLDGSAMVKSDNFVNKGIYIRYLTRALFQNLHVYNTGATGIGVDFLFDSIIRDNIIEKCGFPRAKTGSAGIGIGTGGEMEEPLLIIGNHVSECGLAGILLEAQEPSKEKFLHHIVADNVVRENFQHGILVRGSKRALISTNIVISNHKDGIRLDTYKETPPFDVLIVNNLVQGNGGYGVNLDSAEASDIQVFENNLNDNKLGAFFSKAKPEVVNRINNAGDSDNRILENLAVSGQKISFPNLPTSDPHQSGHLWNDSGTLKISLG